MNTCEVASVTRPPLLDSSNYTYWKARMMAFIKSLDEKAWVAIIEGWSPPVIKNEEGKDILKDVKKWSTDEERAALGNSRAVNAIFTAVYEEQFKLISTCETANEA